MARSVAGASRGVAPPALRLLGIHGKERCLILANILHLVSGCVTFPGGFLIVWGAVSLGLAIREQQGGASIASAISTIAGGAIIIAAAVYFGMLDTSWLPA